MDDICQGYAGDGKSLCINAVLASLRDEYIPQGKGFMEIRLDGWVQTDDLVAMR